MTLAEIKFIYVIDDYIILQIIPNNFELNMDNLVLQHEYDLDNLYSIQKIDTTLNKYKIKFTRNINVHDAFKIYLAENGIKISNCIYIYMCKSLHDGSVIVPTLHENMPSGIYSLSLSSVNDLPMSNIETTYIFCNGLDLNASNVYSNSSSYSTSDNIPININLFDSLSASVPNGKYSIKIKVEKQ